MTSVSDRDIVFLSPFADNVTDATFSGVYAPVPDVAAQAQGLPAELAAQVERVLTATLALPEEDRPFDPEALRTAVYAPATVYENKHVYDGAGSVVWFARAKTDDMLCLNKYATGVFFDRAQQYVLLFPTGKEHCVGLLTFDLGTEAEDINLFAYLPSLTDDDGFLEQDTYNITDAGLDYVDTISSNDETLGDLPAGDEDDEDDEDDPDYVAGADENFDDDEEEFEEDEDEDEDADDEDDENEAGPSGGADMDVAPDVAAADDEDDEEDAEEDEEEAQPVAAVGAPPEAKRRKT